MSSVQQHSDSDSIETPTIEIPIGHNASFDVEPFTDVVGVGSDGPMHDGEITPSRGRPPIPIEVLEKALRRAIENGDSIELHTGDVPSDHDDFDLAGTVEIPCQGEYKIEAHLLGDNEWGHLDNLADNDRRRRAMEKKIASHSGFLEDVE